MDIKEAATLLTLEIAKGLPPAKNDPDRQDEVARSHAALIGQCYATIYQAIAKTQG